MPEQDDDSFWRSNAFNLPFYLCSSKEWCALSEEIQNIVSVNKFKEIIVSFIWPKMNSVFVIHELKGSKLMARLRLNFSHLNEHKFRYSFRDTVDLMCECDLETETTIHFLLRCTLYSTTGTIYCCFIPCELPGRKFFKHSLEWIGVS